MGCAGGKYRLGTRPWCVDSPDCAGRRLRGRCDIDKLLKLREQFCEISSRRQRPRGLPRLGSVQASMGRIHPRSVAVEHFHSCSRAAPRRRPTSPPPPRHTPAPPARSALTLGIGRTPSDRRETLLNRHQGRRARDQRRRASWRRRLRAGEWARLWLVFDCSMEVAGSARKPQETKEHSQSMSGQTLQSNCVAQFRKRQRRTSNCVARATISQSDSVPHTQQP